MQADISDEDLGFGTFNASLEVLGQVPARSEPRKNSFDDPSAQQQFEADGFIGVLDDFDRQALRIW